MSLEKELINSKKIDANNLIAKAEETHYPEDDFVVNELIKLLSKESREFGKTYNNFMNQIKLEIAKGHIIDPDYYETQLSQAIEEVSGDATELQRAENLMKGLKYLGLGDKQTAVLFLSDVPIEENIKTIAIPFSKYADGFIRTYLKYSYETLKRNKIPNYIQVLRKTFCTIAKRYAESQTRKIKLDEESFRESFGNINAELEKKGITIPATDNIKEEFIRICREKYPLAKNNLKNIFENKKFKNEYIEKVIKSLDSFLNDYYSEIIKKTESFIALGMPGEKHGYIVNNVLLNYNTFIKEEYWEDNIIGKYFVEILETFEKDHNRRIKTQEKKKEIKNTTPIDVKEIPIIDEKVNKGWRYTLDEGKNNLIKEAVSYISCEENKKTSIEKFITKLIIKDFPLKLSDIKKIFNLDGIPKESEEILTEKLGLEYEKEKAQRPGKVDIKKEEKFEGKENTEATQEITIKDPIEYFIERIESFNYSIPNKNLLRKQITEYCKNSTYKTVLINLLKNPNFGEILYHRGGHKKARVLPMGRTGWRLLLIKEGKDISVDSFCNHDDYWDRLADIKN